MATRKVAAKSAPSIGVMIGEAVDAFRDALVDAFSSLGSGEVEADEEDDEPTPAPKKRGRPAKVVTPEPDEDEDEDTEDDEAAYDRSELEVESLAELKKLAKGAGYTLADLRGLDKDGVIDLLMGVEAEDDEEDEEEAAEDEDEEEITEEDLQGMAIGELRSLAKEYGIKVSPAMKKAAIIAALMEEG
jgi:hypothetical protein